MAIKSIADLYTDYLIASTTLVTCTGLSNLLDNQVSHDQFTRLLASGYFGTKTLWKTVKPLCQEIKSELSVLNIDDSIEEKPYTDVNGLICWHFDHCFQRSVKGVNFMTALYHSNDISLPVGVEFIVKDQAVITKEGKTKYKSAKTKNELLQSLVLQASQNIYFSYVLADSWYSNATNFNYLDSTIKCHFIMAMKENRKVALSEADKKQGKYVSIKELKLEECPMSVYVKQVEVPLLLTKQVFKNGDGSTGALYLVSNDLSLTHEQMTTIYKKRWKVEQYHQSIKSNTGFSKSPTKTMQTQKSHFMASIIAFVKMEILSFRKKTNHHALKAFLFLSANRAAYEELRKLSTINADFINASA